MQDGSGIDRQRKLFAESPQVANVIHVIVSQEHAADVIKAKAFFHQCLSHSPQTYAGIDQQPLLPVVQEIAIPTAAA
jgi:hypothetical protein